MSMFKVLSLSIFLYFFPPFYASASSEALEGKWSCKAVSWLVLKQHGHALASYSTLVFKEEEFSEEGESKIIKYDDDRRPLHVGEPIGNFSYSGGYSSKGKKLTLTYQKAETSEMLEPTRGPFTYNYRVTEDELVLISLDKSVEASCARN